MSDATEEQIEAAYAVLREELDMAPMARVKDFLRPGMEGQERKDALHELRAADENAERQARDLVRRAIAAVMEADTRRTQLEAIVRALAAVDEWGKTPHGDCGTCGASVDYEPHAESCAWRLARELIGDSE